MCETSLFLVKMKIWDDFDEKERVEYALMQGHTYAEVGAEIDEWAGKDLIECEIFGFEAGPLVISESMARELKEGKE